MMMRIQLNLILKVVTEKKPSDNEIEDMLFAFKVCKHVKSNAIIYVKNKKTIGIGAGQMSRVDSAKIASQKNSEMEKSEENSLENSVVASDAFFPFADGLACYNFIWSKSSYSTWRLC